MSNQIRTKQVMPRRPKADCFACHCEADEVGRSNLNDRLATGYAISRQLIAVLTICLAWLILPQGVCLAAPYTLTITANHGSVRVNPDKALYDEAEVVELIPKPDTGYCFKEWQGDAQSKRLVLNLTMDSDKTIIANFQTWKPPIGIPMPEFGIFETYRMYDDPTKRNPALTYTQNAEGGFYTHYIDNTHPDATDSSNPYGTAEKPRLTIPRNLPAGSVMEIHGGPYYTTESMSIVGTGTATNPVFIRGADTPKPKYMSGGGDDYKRVKFDGSYVIIENIDFDGTRVSLGQDEDHHLVLRHNEVHNGVGTSSAISNGGAVTNVVVFANLIHDNGDWQATEGDPDYPGMKIGSGQYVWAVDNIGYHNAAELIFVGGGDGACTDPIGPDHIYVGRNVAYENRQDGFGIKTATNVIFSQNIAHDNIPTWGKGGFDGTNNNGNVWYLFNEVYNSISAFSAGCTGCAERCGNQYAIGNIVHDVTGKGIYLKSMSSTTESHTYFNTIYNAGTDIANKGGTIYIENNIDSSYPASTFVDAANNDFHLQEGSSAIDAGVLSSRIEEVFDLYESLYGVSIRFDFDGNPRPQGPAWDIGAYEYAPQGALLYGDVTGDGTISATDASRAARYAVGLISLTETQVLAADVTGKAGVTATDAAWIARKAVGLVDKFPVEQ